MSAIALFVLALAGVKVRDNPPGKREKGGWRRHMANTVGENLLCRICGLEVKVVKDGVGIVRCCGEPMAVIAEQK